MATITNTAHVDSAQGSPASDTLGNLSVAVASDITYEMVVTNTGNVTLHNVTLTDTVPSGTTFISVAPTLACSELADTVTCDLGTLNVGAFVTVTLTVQATTP